MLLRTKIGSQRCRTKVSFLGSVTALSEKKDSAVGSVTVARGGGLLKVRDHI